jgi:hypothetical protein
MIGRNPWLFFGALSVIIGVFGLGDMASGASTFGAGESVMFNGYSGTTWAALQSADQGMARFTDLQVRIGGGYLLMVGLLSLAISITALRRGEPWAWLAMGAWPLWTAITLAILLTTPRVPDSGIPVPVVSGSIVFVLSVAGLALSFRKFFPRA